ncbi:hypothetical protein BDW22DRAFT_1354854, partial [Trametopsis cervina]
MKHVALACILLYMEFSQQWHTHQMAATADGLLRRRSREAGVAERASVRPTQLRGEYRPLTGRDTGGYARTRAREGLEYGRVSDLAGRGDLSEMIRENDDEWGEIEEMQSWEKYTQN